MGGMKAPAKELKANPQLVKDALDSGTEKCAKIAKQTLRDVRDRMGFD